MRLITQRERNRYAAILKARELKHKLEVTSPEDPEFDDIVDGYRDAKKASVAALEADLDLVPCFRCGTNLHMEADHVTEVYIHAVSTIPPNEINSITATFTPRDKQFVKFEEPKLVLCEGCLPVLEGIIDEQHVEPADSANILAILARKR